MQKKLPYLAIAIVLAYGLYNAKFKDTQKVEHNANKVYVKHVETHKDENHFKEELSRIKTDAYLKQYIIDVINHGSNQLDFKGGEMEGGFASSEDASKIASYVLELSGRKCNSSYSNDAAMFYTSICGGCHGDDGKGLGGTYPDLTKKKLLGIEKKELFLKLMLSKQ